MIDTLQRIRLFVALYEERSFSLAATREHATQSGVTQHIQKLEEMFGSALFVRARSGVVPTPAADVYYLACVEILRGHRQSRMLMQAFKGGLSGQISVGLTPTLTRAVLAPTLKTFMATHPNVVVQIVDAYSDIIIERVRSGELDCGVVPGAHHVVGLRSELFASSQEILVAGAKLGPPLRQGQPADFRRLGPLKFIVPSKAQARRSTLDGYLASVGAQVERRLEIDTALGALDFVEQTDWVAVVPGIVMLREVSRRTFTTCPLVSPQLTIDLFRIERAREPLSLEVTAFLDVLKSQVDRMTHDADVAFGGKVPRRRPKASASAQGVRP